ncbi:MAG: hypothetical protein IBJ17_18750 [Reyranella sp.]|jgi:hypothetical protein|nr:hypothetical protein [Reyranella sp.]
MSDLFAKPLYAIVPIGSLHTGFALQRDGLQISSHPSPLYLGTLLEALLKGADTSNAHLIAEAVCARDWPSYEERLAHFRKTGPWEPARDPFARRAP